MPAFETKNYYDRVEQHHYFRNYIGKNTGLKYDFVRVFEKSGLALQKLFKVNRIKKSGMNYYKGDNWFSITHELAKYVVDNKPTIKKYFFNTFRADEVFLQTIVMNSPYADTVTKNCMRYIDWERGIPYIFRLEDYNDIINSNMIFARKFSTSVDREIIEKIYTTLKEQSKRLSK